MESEEESKSEDSDSEPEGGEAETTVSQTSSESAKESAANPPLHQSTIETVPTQPPASQTSTRATTATQLLANSTIPASESTKESSANQPLLQPTIETVPTQPADEMATNQLMDDDSLAMMETFVNTVLGDLQYSSNPCEWDWETIPMVEQDTTEQKLDQIISQQHATMSLLEKMQEGQRRIALRLEQLERMARFATPPAHVRSCHPPKPKPVTPCVNRQPLQPVSLNQPIRLDSENRDTAEKPIEDDIIVLDNEDIAADYEIPQSILAEASRDSKHRANFASRLVRRIFSETVLKNSNVRGRRGKMMLNMIKMAAVKDATFKYYPLQPEETARVAWDRCITAVDAYNRTQLGKQ